MNNQRVQTCFKIAVISLAVLLLALQLYHTFYFPMWRDDSQIGSVAKNLAMGNGYQMTLFDKDYPFIYYISTGPVLILPAALMIFIFGNQYWVTSISSVLVIWVLLICIFIASKKVFSKERRWPFSFLALSLMLVSSVLELGGYAFETGDRLGLWHFLMGDISASLLVILGTFLLFCCEKNKKKIFMAGVVLGLAVVDKSITAIAAPMILSVFAMKIFLDQSLKNSKKIILVLVVAAGFIAPSFLFEITKLIALGWQNYSQLQIQNANFYKVNAVITAPIDINGWHIEPKRFNHILYFFELFGLGFFFSILFIFYSTYSLYKNRNSEPQGLNSFFIALALLLAFLMHSFWWTYFSGGGERYLLPGLFYYAALLSLLVVNIKYNWVLGNAVVMLLALLFVGRFDTIHYLMFEGFKDNGRLEEQLKITDIVKDLKQKGVTTISCGNNFEIEYLLPETKNFKECNEFFQNSVKSKKVILVSYFIDSSQYEVSMEPAKYYGGVRVAPKSILTKCDKVYLKTDNFLLRWCRS